MARSVRLALSGEFVPDAVNVQGGAVAEDVRPGLPLAEKLGQLFTALAGGVAARLDVEVRGEIAAYDVGVLQLAALKGVFAAVVEEPVTYVNAPLLAASAASRSAWPPTRQPGLPQPDHRARHAARRPAAVGQRHPHRPPAHREARRGRRLRDGDRGWPSTWSFFRYDDRPGIVGVVGQILGSEGINIAGMQVARDARGGHALIVLTVDSAIPPVVLDDITATIGAVVGRSVDLEMN